MAAETVLSDIGTIQDAPTPATLIDVNKLGGRVRAAICKYVPDTSEDAGSTIKLVKLPKGARVLMSSILSIEAGQDAALTLTMGDDDDEGVGAAVDADRYLLEVTPGTSDVVVRADASANVDAPAFATPYKLGKEAWITLTTGGAALTAKFIIAHIFYVVD